MPLLKLSNPKITPPGYWRVDKDLRTPTPGEPSDYIYGGDLEDLCKKFSDYRISNNLQLGDTQAQVEDWICRNSASKCRPSNPPKPEGDVKARGAMVAQFFRYMAQRFQSSEVVSQEEAERRAEICANCRFNVRVDDAGCVGCFGLAARIVALIGENKTKLDSSLFFCGICGCSNTVSVFAPLPVLEKIYNPADFPEDVNGSGTPCWKRDALNTHAS